MISSGMIWCDTDPKNTMLQVISEALMFYAKKYPDKPANLVVVHPDDFNPNIEYPIEVRPWRYVLPRNPIVGVADDSILQPNTDRQTL